MVRAISATEAQVNVGSMTRQVVDTGDLVIVENHGRPAVAIAPAEKLDRLNELEEQEKRRLALDEFGDFGRKWPCRTAIRPQNKNDRQ